MSNSRPSVDTSSAKTPTASHVTLQKDKRSGRCYLQVAYNDSSIEPPTGTPRGGGHTDDSGFVYSPTKTSRNPNLTRDASKSISTVRGLVTNKHFKNIFADEQFENGLNKILAEANKPNSNAQVTLNDDMRSVDINVSVCGTWCKFSVDLEEGKEQAARGEVSISGSTGLSSPHEEISPHDSEKKPSVKKIGHYELPNLNANKEAGLAKTQSVGNYALMRPTHSKPNSKRKTKKNQKYFAETSASDERPPLLGLVHSKSTPIHVPETDAVYVPKGFLNLDQMKTEDKLRREEFGTYIIRFSGSRPNNHSYYVISYKGDYDKINHHRIRKIKDGWVDADTGAPSFGSVESYMEYALPLCKYPFEE